MKKTVIALALVAAFGASACTRNGPANSTNASTATTNSAVNDVTDAVSGPSRNALDADFANTSSSLPPVGSAAPVGNTAAPAHNTSAVH